MPATHVPHRLGLPRSPDLRHAGTVPTLSLPTVTVKASYLAGEKADAQSHGAPTDWIDAAGDDFPRYVTSRRNLDRYDDVPAAEYWYVQGGTYYGQLILRMRLTPALEQHGGHLRTRVMPAYAGQGLELEMQKQALVICKARGLRYVLVEGEPDGDGRWWLDASVAPAEAVPIDPDKP